MGKSFSWHQYVNNKGDFELPNYLYRLITNLMKTSLDFGTLLSHDPAKLRAFKEQIKTTYKKNWLDLAQALEAFEIITPCGCPQDQYCAKCGGSRYRLNQALNPDEIREIAVVVAPGTNPDIVKKLEEGLERAIAQVEG